MKEKEHILSFAVALPLAQVTAAAALDAYNRIADDWRTISSRGDPQPHDFMARCAHAAMQFGLASELLIKLASFQRKGDYLRGHDLVHLLEALPDDAREHLRTLSEEIAPRCLDVKSLTFDLTEATAEVPPAQLVSWPMDLESIIAFSSDAFVRMRYIYEGAEPGFRLVADFRPLVCLVDSLLRLVQEYDKGNGRLDYRDG